MQMQWFSSYLVCSAIVVTKVHYSHITGWINWCCSDQDSNLQDGKPSKQTPERHFFLVHFFNKSSFSREREKIWKGRNSPKENTRINNKTKRKKYMQKTRLGAQEHNKKFKSTSTRALIFAKSSTNTYGAGNFWHHRTIGNICVLTKHWHIHMIGHTLKSEKPKQHKKMTSQLEQLNQEIRDRLDELIVSELEEIP